MDLNFAGTGSATTATRSDHNHDTVYQKKYGKVAVVVQSGGDYSSPSAALADVATWCGAPSAANPCLVKIMPGVYDTGATPLTMIDFVDMEGSGETNTTISCSIDSVTSGVINGANATLAKLTVTNPGGSDAQNSIAIFNAAKTFHLFQVTAHAAGAVNTYAVYNSGNGSMRIGSSYLDAPGFTIFNGSSATATTFTTAFNGGTVSNTGMLACNASRDGKNIFFAENCPPFQALSVIGSQPDYYFGNPGNPGYPGTSTAQSNSLIKVQFNNDINLTTINTSTFTVMDTMTGSYLNGTAQYDASSRTAIFTPSVALSGSLAATITTGVRDMSGGKLAMPYSWSFFMAGGTADTKPPVIVTVTPIEKSTGLLSATSISATFDEPIDRLTNFTGLLTLKDANGAAILGKVQAYGQQVQFAPVAPLALGVTYTATVSGVKDLAGNTQSAPYSWNFTTAPITAPSGVGASANVIDATITWQPLPGATSYNIFWATTPFSGTTGNSTGSTGTTASPSKITGVTSPYTFTPPVSPAFTGILNIYTSGAAPSQIGSVQFALKVPAGITVTNVSSPYGFSANFNQVGTLVTVAYVNPGYYNGNNSLPLVTVQCSGDFTGKMLAEFSLSNVRVVDQNGSPVNGMNLTTTSNGTAGTSYYFAVTAVNANGESPNSNLVSATIDSLPPVVTGANPTGCNINVPSQIGVSFSEQIDMQSVTAATFAVTANSSPVAGTFGQGSYCGSYGCFSGIMFQPTTPLLQGTSYSITLSGIKDTAGNALQSPYTWDFSTAISAPASLTAIKGDLQSTLTWQAVSGATSYNIYWSTTYGVTPQNGTKISGVTGASYMHTGLTNGTTYYYVVTALYGTAEGLPSNQVSVIIDNVPPTVTSTIPANAATGASISSQINVSFSKSINPSTWSSTNVTLKDNSGAVVNGSYNPYGSPSFTPSLALGFNTTYTMTVGAGVQDNAGNGLATPYSFSFTTAAVGTPSNLVATKGNLQSSLTWTAAAAATGYNIYWSTTYGVTPQNGTKISGVTGTSYTHTGLTNGTTYYYVVTAVNGTAEGLPSSQAQVLIDNVPPTVTSTTPSKDATGASISNPVYVYFSKSINTSTWNNTNVSIKDGAGAVVTGSYSSYGSNYAWFTASPALGFNTTYTMTVGTGVQDSAGNGLAAPYNFGFTTAAVGTPANLVATKGNLQSSLAWTAAAAATSYNIYWSTTGGVTPQNGSKISGVTGTSYTHTGLTNGTTYYYVVTAVNGTAEGLPSVQAQVLIDNVPPTVISTTPTDNSTGASISSSICVNFSKSINASTWNNIGVSIKDGNGAVVNGSYSNYGPCMGPSFTPSPALGFNTTYTMTVGTGVQDYAGNGMATPYTFSFKTAAVGTPAGLSAVKGNLQSSLTWTAAATGYNIYWSATPGVTPQNGSKISGVAGTSYMHTGLTNGTTYYYVVTAVNGTVEGLPSMPTSVLLDNVPPLILSTTPSNNATSVSATTAIQIGFNKMIEFSTFNATTFAVENSSGQSVTGSLGNYPYAGVYAVGFVPNTPLSINTTYIITISGIKDIAGNSLATPYSFSFTTMAVGTPSNLVATKGNLQSSLTWTAAAAATGYNIYWSTTYGVTPQNGTKISNVTGTSYTHTGLTNGTTYYYVVTAVNGTVEGLPSMQAQVLIDNVPPTVTSTTPSNGSTGASISSSICANFSKYINNSTWNNVNVSIKDGNGAVVNGSYNYSCFYPSPALAFNATYTMTVGTGVQDNAGNGLATPYSFSFTTAMATPMGLVATAGNLQSALAWTPVSGATSYNIYWSNTTGITKTNSIKISTGTSASTYSHTNLANGSTYVYRVAAVVGSNESDLSNEVKVSFDTAAPVVSEKEGGGAGNYRLYVHFNEPIDTSTVSSDTIQVTSSGTTVSGNSYANSNTMLVWSGPTFNYGIDYTVTVSGVKDIAGNLMAPYSWTFTTATLGVPSVAATAGGPGSNQITLSWQIVGGATTYNVYWATTPGVTTANGTKIVGAMPPFTHTGLTAGTTYYYVVTAVSGGTEGAASLPLPPLGTDISAVAP